MRDKLNAWWARQGCAMQLVWVVVFLLPLWGPIALVRCTDDPEARREYEQRQADLRHQERVERYRARKEQRQRDNAEAARIRQEREAAAHDRATLEPGDKVKTSRRVAAFASRDKAELHAYCIEQEEYETAKFTYEEAANAGAACKLMNGHAYDVVAVEGDLVQVRDGGALWWTANRWLREVEE